MTARAALAAALLLAGCGRVQPEPAGERRLSAGSAAHGFSVSPDGRLAAWVEGEWPDRTRLALLDLATGRRERVRHKGYSLVETAFSADGALKVLARKTGASAHPRNPPKRAAILSLDRRGALLSAEEDPNGRILERRAAPWHQGAAPAGDYASEGHPDLIVRGARGTVWIASSAPGEARWLLESFDETRGERTTRMELPGPAESLLPAGDALYVLTRSSESLSRAARGPRTLAKIDLLTGRVAWAAPWAPRPSELLARSPGGRLFAAVKDPQAPSLWSFEDRAQSAAAAGAAAAAPGAGRSRTLRTAGLFLVRFLPALVLVLAAFVFLRR